jgi:hypothetical protein
MKCNYRSLILRINNNNNNNSYSLENMNQYVFPVSGKPKSRVLLT